MQGRLTVLVVEDHPMMSEALCTTVACEPDLEVIGHASNGQQAVEMALRLLPDVLVMDLNLPVKDGITAISEIMRAEPGMRILAITSSTEESRVLAAVEAGVLGYLLKDAARDEFLRTLREVAHGRTCLPPAVAAKLARGVRLSTQGPAVDVIADTLTSREQEVLGLVGTGLSNRKIAAQLCLSEVTVRVHVRNILQKLGFEERGEAIMYAMQRPMTNLSKSAASQLVRFP
jgi:DNA-binding NarL/FixJ family response regulator